MLQLVKRQFAPVTASGVNYGRLLSESAICQKNGEEKESKEGRARMLTQHANSFATIMTPGSTLFLFSLQNFPKNRKSKTYLLKRSAMNSILAAHNVCCARRWDLL